MIEGVIDLTEAEMTKHSQPPWVWVEGDGPLSSATLPGGQDPPFLPHG